jgi:hypothetical protein
MQHTQARAVLGEGGGRVNQGGLEGGPPDSAPARSKSVRPFGNTLRAAALAGPLSSESLPARSLARRLLRRQRRRVRKG